MKITKNRKSRRSLLSIGRKLQRDEDGVALMEFAFALPIVLTLILGGLETANFALAHLRVSQIAMTVADNAGRVDTTVDEANIYEVFAGADLVGEAIEFEANGRVVLSSLQPNGETGSDEGQWINWQRCWGSLGTAPAYGVEGDGEDDNALVDGMGPDANKISSAEGTAVMFVEVTYDYQPLVAQRILGNRTIHYESAFNVRDRTNQNISNTQNLNVNRCT